jgi:hypothetical protein
VTFGTGSNIASGNFGSYAFPQDSSYGDDNLKTRYLQYSTKAGVFWRTSTNPTWTKQ